jgi:hypothetical protein
MIPNHTVYCLRLLLKRKSGGKNATTKHEDRPRLQYCYCVPSKNFLS